MSEQPTTGMIPLDESGERYMMERHYTFLDTLLIAGRWLQTFYDNMDETDWVEFRVKGEALEADLQRLKDVTLFSDSDLRMFVDERVYGYSNSSQSHQ